VLLAALVLAQVTETITVTATRTETRIGDTPASVVVLTREELETSAAPTLDDALRQVAGFTLFRRAGSRVANPTTQGVTLRGVGASGASRALVLDDGVPLNDPFGGWVYWGRVPRAALERAEVLRGGASDLYGSTAMGGVVQFLRRNAPGLTVDASAGSLGTGTLSLFAGATRGKWSGSVAGDFLTTSGWVPVEEASRGIVDVEADSQHQALDATIRRGAGFLRLSRYQESRANGTPLQENDTTILHASAGLDLGAAGGLLTLRAYGNDQDYFQTFSAVAADRASERLTVEQEVPSYGLGASAQYTRTLSDRHALVAGSELRGVSGTSEEQRFTPAGTFEVEAGGTQRLAAAFVEDLFVVSPSLTLTAGLRADWWRNEGEGAELTEGQLNPRLGLLWRMDDGLVFSASAYTAFRSPTLNELYRGFRVGNVETLPNALLKSEELTGVEIGARVRGLRATLFHTSVSDTIANVTLAQTPGLITRQRQNLGRSRSRGLELDGSWRLRDWGLSASWLFVDATVRDGALRGNRLPQVPRSQATAQAAWRGAGVQLRWSSEQFDDDLNELVLDEYVVADLFVSRAIRSSLSATLAVENVFDERIESAASPVVTLGQPRAWRVGLRYAR
jgi:outer membrane receptor protein involved in Fe transport